MVGSGPLTSENVVGLLNDLEGELDRAGAARSCTSPGEPGCSWVGEPTGGPATSTAFPE